MTLSMSMPTVKGYMTYEMGGYTVVPGVVDPAVKALSPSSLRNES